MMAVQQVPLNNAGGQTATATSGTPSLDFSPGASVHSTRQRRLSVGHKVPLPSFASGARHGHGSRHRSGRSHHRAEGHYSKIHGFLGASLTSASSIRSISDNVIHYRLRFRVSQILLNPTDNHDVFMMDGIDSAASPCFDLHTHLEAMKLKNRCLCETDDSATQGGRIARPSTGHFNTTTPLALRLSRPHPDGRSHL